MKIIKNSLFILLLSISVKADIVSDFLKKNYKAICNYSNIQKFSKNEKALSIIGVSCIKTDNLYLLPYIVKGLKRTDYGRKNGIYFLTIYMQKKLLYSYMFDRIKLENFNFPMTDYVLSKIFDAIKNKKYRLFGDKYIIKDNTKAYHLYKEGDKMFVDTYENGKLIKRRWYR